MYITFRKGGKGFGREAGFEGIFILKGPAPYGGVLSCLVWTRRWR